MFLRSRRCWKVISTRSAKFPTATVVRRRSFDGGAIRERVTACDWSA